MAVTHSADGRQGNQVGLLEVPVVLCLFLRPPGAGASGALVPVPGLLPDGVARLEQVDLTAGLVLDGPAQGAQRVEVLDLTALAELGVADAAHAHVGIDPQRALLHLGVRGAGGQEDGAELVDVGLGLLRVANVGATHDLDQGDAGAVVVDERVVGPVDAAAATGMGVLAGVLLDVGPLDADARAVGEVEPAVDVDGPVELGDLVVLRHVRVEVVLPGEDRGLDAAVEGPAEPHGQLDHLVVEHRQRAREAQAHRADVGVGLVAEHVRATAEELGGGGQLAVDLEAHHDLPGVAGALAGDGEVLALDGLVGEVGAHR